MPNCGYLKKYNVQPVDKLLRRCTKQVRLEAIPSGSPSSAWLLEHSMGLMIVILKPNWKF